MYLCKLVQVIYVRLLSWRLYSFFIGKNKKNFKKTLNFYVHAWNAKHPNGISVIHVIEDIMILFVFEKKIFLIVGFICGYRVISPRKNIPFTVELLDRTTGEAQVKVAEGRKVSFEKRKRYKFSVIAYDCGQPARESNR